MQRARTWLVGLPAQLPKRGFSTTTTFFRGCALSLLAAHTAQYQSISGSRTTSSSIHGSWHRWCHGSLHPSQKTIWLLAGLCMRVHRLHSACSVVRVASSRFRFRALSSAAGSYVSGLSTWRPDFVIVGTAAAAAAAAVMAGLRGPLCFLMPSPWSEASAGEDAPLALASSPRLRFWPGASESLETDSGLAPGLGEEEDSGSGSVADLVGVVALGAGEDGAGIDKWLLLPLMVAETLWRTLSYVDCEKVGRAAPAAVTDAKAELRPPVSPRIRFKIIWVAAENWGTYGVRVEPWEVDLLALPTLGEDVRDTAEAAGDSAGRAVVDTVEPEAGSTPCP